MRIIAVLGLLILFALFSVSPLVYLLSKGEVELTLLLVVSLGLLGGISYGGTGGFGGGFLLGIFTMQLLAVRTIFYALIGVLSGLLRKSLYLNNPLAIFFAGVLAAFSEKLLYFWLSDFPGNFFSLKLLYALLINGLVILPIYYLLSLFWEKEALKARGKW